MVIWIPRPHAVAKEKLRKEATLTQHGSAEGENLGVAVGKPKSCMRIDAPFCLIDIKAYSRCLCIAWQTCVNQMIQTCLDDCNLQPLSECKGKQ